LFTGTVIAQLIVLGITPFLTRIYAESFFGILTLFTSVIATLKILVTLRYEITLLLPKRDKDAINLLILNIIVITIMSLIILLITILLKNSINNLFEDGGLNNFVYLIAPGVFSLGLIDSFTYWNNRFQNYDKISYSRINKSVSGSVAQILIGYSEINFIGLIPGMLIGQFISLFYFLRASYRNIKTLTKFISLSRMMFLLKKYKDIPKYNTLISLANTFSSQMPGFLLPNLYGLTLTGYYGLSNRIVGTPFGLILQSFGQVFYKKLSDTYNNKRDEFYSLVKKTYKNLLYMSLLLSSVIFVATYFFEFFFGEGWVEAGKYSRILLPALFISVLNSPISSIIVVLNKQKIMLVYDLLLLSGRFLSIFSGFYFFKSIVMSLILFSVTGVCFNIVLVFIFLSTAKKVTN